MRILCMIVCLGKKLYCYSAEGEFLTEKKARHDLLLCSRL